MAIRAAVLSANVVIKVIMLNKLSEIPGAIDGTDANVGDTWNGVIFVKPVPPTPGPPSVVDMAQARKALIALGKIASVQALFNSLPEPQKTYALIDFEYKGDVHRTHPLVQNVKTALGWTEADLDTLFLTASTL